MHEFGAKLRIISELKKELREKYNSWALQGKISQIIINQVVNSGQSRKEAENETLKSALFPIKALSLQQKEAKIGCTDDVDLCYVSRQKSPTTMILLCSYESSQCITN